MMMITKMTKISSLFVLVLAGMISRSSALNWCTTWENEIDCKSHGCKWTGSDPFFGECVTKPSTEAATLSFISLDSGVGLDNEHYLGAEEYTVDKDFDESGYDNNDALDGIEVKIIFDENSITDGLVVIPTQITSEDTQIDY